MIYATEEKYFAASNSAAGFLNYYPRVFDRETLDHLYIIKGGPGTGKSSFMRDVANRAEREGDEVVYFYCSSDPDSLDGILLKERNIAFLDGTAPHETDPVYPGAVDEIIHLGEFWDAAKIAKSRSYIKTLTEDKRRCYGNAYSYLSAYGEQSAVRDRLLADCILRDKMRGAVERLMKKFPIGEGGQELPYLIGSIGMRGRVAFDTYREKATTVYAVRDVYGMAHVFLQMVREAVRQRGLLLYVSPHPICPEKPEALHIPALGVSLLVGEALEGDKVINMKRFLNADVLERVRDEIKFAEKSRKDMIWGASYSLGEAATAHFALEKIYRAAMDFDRKEKYTVQFLRRLFG